VIFSGYTKLIINLLNYFEFPSSCLLGESPWVMTVCIIDVHRLLVHLCKLHGPTSHMYKNIDRNVPNDDSVNCKDELPMWSH
jgi:hypothetical protein